MPKVTQMPALPLPSPASAYQIFELKCVAKLKQTTAARGKGEGEEEEGRRAAKWQFEDSRDSRQKAKGTKTN